MRMAAGSDSSASFADQITGYLAQQGIAVVRFAAVATIEGDALPMS